MFKIVCPKCGDIWYSQEQYNRCKCFKCNFEYIPKIIKIEEWIIEAMRRCKG